MNPRNIPQTAAPWPCTLVTGATSGLGHELAVQLAAAGAPVVALGRREAALRDLAERFPNVHPVCADLADTAAIPSLAARLVARHPDLACVLHNAAVQHDVRLDDPGSGSEAIAEEVAVNLTAPLVLTQALWPHLRQRPAAWVVHVTSGLAYVPKPSAAVYCATKAGLHLFAEASRLQARGSTVNVVEVVLPLVDTAMTAGRTGRKMPAPDAARAILAGLRDGRPVIRVGKARAMPVLQRWAPWVLARLMQRG